MARTGKGEPQTPKKKQPTSTIPTVKIDWTNMPQTRQRFDNEKDPRKKGEIANRAIKANQTDRKYGGIISDNKRVSGRISAEYESKLENDSIAAVNKKAKEAEEKANKINSSNYLEKVDPKKQQQKTNKKTATTTARKTTKITAKRR